MYGYIVLRSVMFIINSGCMSSNWKGEILKLRDVGNL